MSCRRVAEGYSWEASTRQFLTLIQPRQITQAADPEPTENCV
jgi:hypothetical protein